jgi:hypothetical protein
MLVRGVTVQGRADAQEKLEPVAGIVTIAVS